MDADDDAVRHIETLRATFHQAVYAGDIDAIRRLLKHSDIDPAQMHRRYLLSTHAKNRAQVLELVLHDGRYDITEGDNIAFRMYCEDNELECVRLLLKDPRVDPRASDFEALYTAISYNRMEFVQLFFSENLICDKDYQRALETALSNHHIDMVRMFYARADITTKWVLQTIGNYPEIAQLLISDLRFNPQAENNWYLMWATKHEFDNLITVLVNAGCPATIPGRKTLIRAVAVSNVELVCALVKRNQLSQQDYKLALKAATKKDPTDATIIDKLECAVLGY
jgi:ankyrin repeat protein